MSKSDLTINPTGTTRGFNGRNRLLALIVGLLAFAGFALAGPTASQAAHYMSTNAGTNSIDGTTQTWGPVGQGNSASKTLYMYSNTFQVSSVTRRSVVTLSNSAFYGGSGCSMDQKNDATYPTSFRVSMSQGSFSSSGNCSFTVLMRDNLAPGTYTGTLSFSNAASYTSGSATIVGYVTEENGASIRVYDPDSTQGPYDFGGVAVGDSSTRTFTLKNTGSTQMTGGARAVSGSPSYSITGTNCGATLDTFGSCTVNVTYQPTAAGTDNGSLDFTSGSGHSRSISLSGQAFAPTADLSVSPMTFDYEGVPSGYPAGNAFTVTNEGNTTLDISYATDTDPAVVYRDGGTCGATLAVGNSCTMIVNFNPDPGGAASQTGSFTVTGSSPLVGSPVSKQVTVEGTRVAPVAGIEVRDTPGTSELSSYDFGAVALGSSGNYTFSVTNTGNVPVPSISAALSGPEAGNYAITGNTCGSSIPRDGTCSVSVSVTPTLASVRRATLTMTPGASANTAAPKTVQLTTSPSGIRIKNDVSDSFGSTAKRWLDSPSLGTAGLLAGDIVRTAFEVELPPGSSIAGVDIVGSTTTNDVAPSSGYQNITDLSAGSVTVDRKPGSSQALVKAAVPLSSTNLGTSGGNYGFSSGTDAIVSCGIFGSSTGTGETSDRRVWFRIRGSNGEVSSTVGTIVRFHWQTYACPYQQGPYLSNQRILNVNGGSTLPSGTIETNANKTDEVTFQFQTRTYAAGAVYPGSNGNVDAIDWRIRNSKTGDMFIVNNSNYAVASYVPCARPCTVTSSNNRYNFPDGSAAGTKQFTIPPIPSRGRWIVEASPQGSDENDASYFELGVVNVNDRSGNSPTISKTGTLNLRPNTDEAYTIGANVADPADPTSTFDTQGGRGQVIEWDLDGDTNNGPRGDGFEVLAESDPGSPLSSEDLTQTFDTTGKTPGPYTIRARVTDNGAFMANDSAAESKIMTYTTTINSPAEAQATTEEFESDQSQPADVPFIATDVDGDSYRVDITPNGSNVGTLGGNLNDGIGQNTKPYTWPATFTGSDTFDFVATDDHNGTGSPSTLTVRVRPNTQIDTATVSGLLHPDESNPATRFLGSTTSTDAEFTFSSLQNPVVEMECRLLNDGDTVEDWTSCASDDNGSISYTGLEDGLHRVEVRAVNDEGDRDGTPAFRTWRVDNTAPEVEVFQGPPSDLPNQQPRFTNDSTPSYKFSATADERSLQQYMTYECRVMWGPAPGIWYPCGSPSDTNSSSIVHIVNGTPDFGISDPLPDGTYEIQVRGTDELGNLGPAMVEQFTVDTIDPETALASGPEGLINTRDVDFVLGSSQGQSTFLCKLEGDNSGVVYAQALCPGSSADGSRPSFTGLADDTYTLTATAVDPATNPDPTPLLVEFEVDATEPTTTMDPNVEYGDGPTLLRRTQSRKVDVTFTGADTRQMQGFQCRIDSTDENDWQICSSPQRFSGLSDGDHVVEIRAKDQAGNVDSTPEVLEWNVDLDPPVSSFTAQPNAVSNDANPSFEFTANEAISGSVCSLDGGAPVACTSPVTLADLGAPTGVADGNHQVTVRSTDLAGNVEAAVATATWRQDTVNPEVTFTSKPAEYMPAGDADFAWEVKDDDPLVLAPEADAECAVDPVDPDNVDSGEWVPCDRALTIAEVDNTDGAHNFVVRAIDQAGNVSAPVKWTWNVLIGNPASPVIDDSSPADGETTRVGTAYFAFSHELEGTGGLDGLFCSIDGGVQTRCEFNYGVEGLSDGEHTFSIVAKDIAGNISAPTTITWDVQRGAPVTAIDFGPNGMRKQATASFQFSSDKPGTFECKLDGGTWEACASPVDLTDLADGQHNFSVRAVSSVAPVGVKDPTPPSRSWTVDTVAPDVTIDSAPQGQVVSYQGEVTFQSTDPDAGFQCKVNDGLFDSCSSPFTATGLTAGEATVTVRAVDPAGNVSATPATATWTVLDPSCGNDFDGTPPDCVEKPEVTGPALTAESTSGELAVPSLGEAVPLPENQIKLEGRRGSDGRWFVPKEGITFQPVEQVLADVLGPGLNVTVKISISATGNGWGLLTNGGGVATMKIPVRADVDAKLGSTALFPSGTCSLDPVTFNLTGTWDATAMTASLEQPDVGFPKLTGCGTFKETIDGLLELPRNDIELGVELKLTEEAQACEPPQTGTFPDCVDPVDPVITIGKPAIKGTKLVKSGKKANYFVKLTNTGDTEATNVKACLATPKRFIKGKATRCKNVASIGAGKSVNVKFALKAKKFKLKKQQKIKLRATASYTDGAGVARTAANRYTAKAGKTGSASGK